MYDHWVIDSRVTPIAMESLWRLVEEAAFGVHPTMENNRVGLSVTEIASTLVMSYCTQMDEVQVQFTSEAPGGRIVEPTTYTDCRTFIILGTAPTLYCLSVAPPTT